MAKKKILKFTPKKVKLDSDALATGIKALFTPAEIVQIRKDLEHED